MGLAWSRWASLRRSPVTARAASADRADASADGCACVIQGPMTKYRVKTMACSETFNVAVTEGGPCYAWGCVDEGRLGIG
eukprot:2488698-Rhodomonas_salina.3